MRFTATEILNMKEPGELFSGNPHTLRDEFVELNKEWHPSLHGNSEESNEVTKQINIFYVEGKKLIEAGKWKRPGFIKLKGKNNKSYEIKYRISYDFELGKMYISDTVVLYLLEKTNKDLFENAINIISNFRYENDNMKKEMSKYLPKIIDKFETTENQMGLVIQKTPDMILLRDVHNYYAGNIPSVHVAWILSILHNLLCYLDYAGLSHNSITLDTYFISPLYHSGALLGGWWYSVEKGKKMIGVPDNIYSIMPPIVKDSKLGSIQTDSESIRFLGREISGDAIGTRLMDIGEIPLPMINWLRGVSSPTATALENYIKWGEVLDKSFGKRKFVEMKLSANELYSKIINK